MNVKVRITYPSGFVEERSEFFLYGLRRENSRPYLIELAPGATQDHITRAEYAVHPKHGKVVLMKELL
jgi:hypothetical protein